MLRSKSPSVFGFVNIKPGDFAMRAQLAQVIEIGKTFGSRANCFD